MLKFTALTVIAIMCVANSIWRFSDIAMPRNQTHSTTHDYRTAKLVELPPRTVSTFNVHSMVGSWYEVYHSTNIGEVWGGSVSNRSCIQVAFKPLTSKTQTQATFLRFLIFQKFVNIWSGIITHSLRETAEGKLILQEKGGIESRRRFQVYIIAFESYRSGYLALSDPLGIHLQVLSRSKQFSVSQQSRVLRRHLAILGFTETWNMPRLTLHDNCTYW